MWSLTNKEVWSYTKDTFINWWETIVGGKLKHRGGDYLYYSTYYIIILYWAYYFIMILFVIYYFVVFQAVKGVFFQEDFYLFHIYIDCTV